MIHRTVAVLLLAGSLPLLAASKPQPMPPMTAEKWRADLDFFERELPKRHKNAFHTVTRERFAGRDPVLDWILEQ